MREAVLDGAQMTTKEELHDRLMEELELPYYYGRNLDSLWNILRKEGDPIRITIRHPQLLVRGYGEVLLELFADLSAENSNYNIVIEQ